MSYTFHAVEEKDEGQSMDEESQDTEALLPTSKPGFISSRPHVFWLSLHLLLTFGLLVGLRLQSSEKQVPTCPKLLPLELRKMPSILHNLDI
jgi:hypothetical protein